MSMRSAFPFALAAALAAQQPQGDGRADPPLLLDRVVATVNDAVILQSELMTLAAGPIAAKERELRRQLAPPERLLMLRQALELKVNQHALAQGAKTLGVIPPERVDVILDDMLADDERKRIRELGSLQKLTEERARQNQGQSWQMIEKNQRVEKAEQLTQEMTVFTRLQYQRNLFITPRMMRDYYRRNREQFVHSQRALLGSIAIQGDNAAATAAEIATAWQKEELSPDEIVARFGARGAIAPETIVIDDKSREVRRQDQVEFALAGPQGKVSDPIEGGAAIRLWKVLEFLPARNDPFDDPAVQRAIRDRMERDVVDQLLQNAIARSRLRTEVWKLDDLR